MEPEALEDLNATLGPLSSPTLLGGVSRTLRFARVASRLGVRPVISSAYESGVGTYGLIALAAEVGD
jgi:O-succinylbenzoate synthase